MSAILVTQKRTSGGSGNTANGLSAAIAQNTPSSCESDTVALQALVTNGAPPYTYTWSNGTNMMTAYYPPGATAVVVVVDAGGVSTTAQLTIPTPNCQDCEESLVYVYKSCC